MPTDPRWSQSDTLFISHSWQGMAAPADVRARLLERGLGEDFFDTLKLRTEMFEDGIAGKGVAVGVQKASTQDLQKVMDRSADLISALRATLKRLFPKETGLHSAVGIGKKEPLKGLPNLVEAADLMLEGLERYQSFATAANVLPADITQLTTLRNELRTENARQEALKGARKNTTAAVRSLHREVIGMLDRLFASVMLAYAGEKHVIAAWKKVIPTRKKTA